MQNLTTISAVTVVLFGLAGASASIAQDQSAPAPETEAPAAAPNDNMMQGGDMGGMMGRMTEMNKMMEACTKMMQTKTPGDDGKPGGSG